MKLSADDLDWGRADKTLREVLLVPEDDIAKLMARAGRFPGKPQVFTGPAISVTVTCRDRRYSVRAE